MASITKLVALLFLVQLVHSFEIKQYQDDKSAQIESINISACPNASGEYCVLTLGSNVTHTVTFETVKPFKRAILQVGARKNGDVFYDHWFGLACDYLGLKCPCEASQKQVLTYVSEINKSFPQDLDHYRMSLYDELKNIIFSIEFPVKVVQQ